MTQRLSFCFGMCHVALIAQSLLVIALFWSPALVDIPSWWLAYGSWGLINGLFERFSQQTMKAKAAAIHAAEAIARERQLLFAEMADRQIARPQGPLHML